MKSIQHVGASQVEVSEVSRRSVIGRLMIGGAAAALLSREALGAEAQEGSPAAGECVTTAPALDESGIAFVPLLVGGVVRDMPTGPVEVRISRLAMAPGTVIEPGAVPYPALMYIENRDDCLSWRRRTDRLCAGWHGG